MKRKKVGTSWNKFEDAKLLKLFNLQPRGRADSHNLNVSYIKTVLEDHLSERTYSNFPPFCRRNVRALNIDTALDGKNQIRDKVISHFH